MRRVFAIFLFVPIYFLAMFSLYVTQILSLENQSLEEFRLRKAVNYCVDSAVGEMLGSGDLNMDYVDWGRVTIDPAIAIDTYSCTFCLNYEIPTTKENREMVQNSYTKIFMVCAYDGYYVYESQDLGFVSTPKLIYKYVDGDNTYALNLGLNKCWCWNNSRAKMEYVDCPFTEETCLAKINARISDDLNSRLDKYYVGGFTKTVYLPGELTTINRTNPISRPTVMALVDDVDITSARHISALGIGGSTVTQARAVAAYQRKNTPDGPFVKYYSYADLLPEGLFSATNSGDGITFIENMYMTCEEAARAGYYQDPMYMN